jgi:hypothetical protein
MFVLSFGCYVPPAPGLDYSGAALLAADVLVITHIFGEDRFGVLLYALKGRIRLYSPGRDDRF